MNNPKINKWLSKAVLICAFAVTVAQAADPAPVIIGKNDWLFTPYEFALAADQQDTQASIQLFEKINKLLI